MNKSSNRKTKNTILLTNRRASYDYIIIDSFEVGMVLSSKEVRSIRNKSANINGTYAVILNNELWVMNMFSLGYNSVGSKTKLLCHKSEILDVKSKTETRGLTAIPLSLYLKDNLIKMTLGICKGKNKADKREHIKNEDIKRDIRRIYK